MPIPANFQPRRGPQLEIRIENKVVKWAKENGIGSRKMNGQGNRSWPDRMFYSARFRPETKVVFIEFKREGKEPTPLQEDKIAELEACGIPVNWFDNYEGAVQWLSQFLA